MTGVLDLRSVALEVVVDVHSDTRITGFVRSRQSDFRRIGTSAATDVDLSTADVL